MVEASLRNFLPNPVSPINDAGVTSHASPPSKPSEISLSSWLGLKSFGQLSEFSSSGPL